MFWLANERLGREKDDANLYIPFFSKKYQPLWLVVERLIICGSREEIFEISKQLVMKVDNIVKGWKIEIIFASKHMVEQRINSKV